MRPKSVLIVEDSPDNRAIYHAVLEFAGFDVFEAANGAEGVRMAHEHHPDLILMDLSMPVMDGWEATRSLKAEDDTASIPVCALSAHVLVDGDWPKVQEAGFDCYLTKPIEPKQVLAEVHERIGPALAPAPNLP